MNNSRKTILISFPYYLPITETGPVQSISNIVNNLGNRYDFKIITSAEVDGEMKIDTNRWNNINGAEVLYLKKPVKTLDIYKILKRTSYDLLYLNSLFNIKFTLVPLMCNIFNFGNQEVPIVLAPRGQLSKGAMGLKNFRKSIYTWVIKRFGIQRYINWHATNKIEKENVQKFFPNGNIFIAGNISKKKNDFNFKSEKPNKKEDLLNVLFLSRITPKKNLLFALKILSELKVNINFEIYGPIQDEKYWSKCKEKIKSIPKNISIEYKGSVTHNKVYGVISRFDLFFLPTLGENYGHVIQESLTVGTPVLISDQTPWKNLRKKGIGWDIPLSDINEYKNVIIKCFNKNSEKYLAWRKRIVEWERKRQNSDESIYSHIEMFRKVNKIKANE